MENKLEVYIHKPMFLGDSDFVKVFAILTNGRMRQSVQYNSEAKLLQVTELKENEANKVEPLFELPLQFFNELTKQMVVYASENNIKTDNELVVQGKLTATEKHLEDLRGYFAKTLDAALSK
ncbi:MAG: hypothetical protein WAS34_18940 [Thiolinea sp.]